MRHYTRLGGANLNEAELFYTNLSGAELPGINLSDVFLAHVDLSQAKLNGVNLSGANLKGANLEGADLENANLNGTNLEGTHLSGADLDGANLSWVKFEPKNLPDAHSIAYAKNIELMQYINSQEGLIKLRKLFKETGFYEQERKITYTINHGRLIKEFDIKNIRQFGKFFEVVFTYILFDITTKWGMAPGRALLALLILIPVFAVPYVIALGHLGVDGIWLKWSDDRMRTNLGTKKPILLRLGRRRALVFGLYFSLLSAFITTAIKYSK